MIIIKTAKEYANDEEKKQAIKDAVAEFKIKNEEDLKRLLLYKTGILDKSMIQETLSDFYYRLLQSDALLTFDEKGKSSFDSYITSRLCWIMPVQAKKNSKHKNIPLSEKYKKRYVMNSADPATMDYELLSYVQPIATRARIIEDDVFEQVSKEHATYKVSSAYETSLFDTEADPVMTGYIEDFKAYIRSTENPGMASKMITYLDNKLEGCRGVMIASLMKSTKKNFSNKVGVSNNMVKIIRKSLQKKYLKWQSIPPELS